MKFNEVDSFLRTYSKAEKEALIKEMRGHVPGCGEPGLMESRKFLKKFEAIGIHKNDRFMPVVEHLHDYIELMYVWSGELVQHINGKKVVCKKGDVCILNTHAVHTLEKGREEDIVVNILMRKELFDHAFVGRLAKQGVVAEFLIESAMERRSRYNYLLFQTDGTEGFQGLITRLISEYYSDKLGRHEVLKNYISVIFTELLRTYDEAERRYVKKGREAVIFQILEYIEKNYQNCSLAGAAETFGFHPTYLTMMLKEVTGKSFLEHVHEQKLSKARNLLTGTEVPVVDIISLCGYQNLSFFYQKFKAAEGMTPAAYRKRNRI